MGRTTHRSTAGRKLYAVRDAGGRFRDIQQYQRAHGEDVRRRSTAETAARGKVTGPHRIVGVLLARFEVQACGKVTVLTKRGPRGAELAHRAAPADDALANVTRALLETMDGASVERPDVLGIMAAGRPLQRVTAQGKAAGK